MSFTVNTLKNVASELEAELAGRPFEVINESEFQALLHAKLLERFSDEPALTLGDGVVNRRPGFAYRCRRVYREAKVHPGISGKEPDIVILSAEPQLILPKQNKAPSRFMVPYDAIIETKMDASPKDVIGGRYGRPLKQEVINGDIGKWQVGKDAASVVNIIYTAVPEAYEQSENTILVRRPIAITPPCKASQKARNDAMSVYEEAVDLLYDEFCAQPFRFLREKDFETYLFAALRRAVDVEACQMHPVRTQYVMDWRKTIGRNRRHDLVILGKDEGTLALEIELKTSHSDQHNWFRKVDLKKEFEAINGLKNMKFLDRGVFLLFRYGEEKWLEDAKAVCADFPFVDLDYRCAESTAQTRIANCA